MSSIFTNPTSLMIQQHTCCQINELRVEIESHLGQFADVHYFQVMIYNSASKTDKVTNEVESGELGLLRVGSIDGGLGRELQLRQTLGNYKMVSELLAVVTESVSISSHSPFPGEELNEAVNEEESPSNKLSFNEIEPKLEAEPEYLEEEFYEEKEVTSNLVGQKLILISYLPEAEETLEAWLRQSNPLETSLLLASQVCQFFRYIYQHSWCCVQLFSKFIQMGTPVKFFDLTGVYPVGNKLTSSFIGDYCAPEFAYDIRYPYRGLGNKQRISRG